MSRRRSRRCSIWAGRSPAVLDFDELLAQIPRLIARLIEFDAFAVYLLDERRGELRVAYAVGYPDSVAPMRAASSGQGLVGAAVASQMPLLVNDVAADPRYVAVVPGMGVGAGRAAAAQEAADRRAEHPQPQQGSVHRGATSSCCASSPRTSRSAIVNARLFERSAHDADAFETLAEIGRDVASVLELDELFSRIAQSMRRAHRLPHVRACWLVNEERARARDQARGAVRREGAACRASRSARGSSATRRCTRSRCWSPDVSEDPRYINVVADVRSELAIPMLLKDRCIGVLDLESPELDAFTKRDVEILTLLASQAAVAIENARLYETVRANEVRLEKELRFAQRVQAALLPVGLPKRMKGVDVGGALRAGARARRRLPRLSVARSRTPSSSRSATCRARACRRRSTACSPRS